MQKQCTQQTCNALGGTARRIALTAAQWHASGCFCPLSSMQIKLPEYVPASLTRYRLTTHRWRILQVQIIYMDYLKLLKREHSY